jgi:glycine oxidase
MARTAVIVGGGIIGCALAHDLAKAGCRVTVLERGNPGAEASSAAAGLVAPLGESARPDALQELALRSWRLYPGVVAELERVSGVDVEYMTRGTLYPLLDETEVAEASERARSPLAAELGVRVIEGPELRAAEPELASDVSAALFAQGDHWVNNESLVSAYAAAAATHGARIKSGAEVRRILVEGGQALGALVDGERFEAEAVVLAAGAWSGGLAAELGLRLPVTPVRGQMLAVDHTPALLTHVVHAEGVYLVPRRSGELLIGATVEHVGWERAVTPEALEGLITAAVRLVPELENRSILRSWCGFRPWAPDGFPVLGPWPGIEGLYVATAHFRNGILLAPATAALLTGCIMSGGRTEGLEAFLPDRFLGGGH